MGGGSPRFIWWPVTRDKTSQLYNDLVGQILIDLLIVKQSFFFF